MREIEFRGLSLNGLEWFYGYYFLEPRGDVILRIIDNEPGYYAKANITRVQKDTIGQFTGIFDKNGNKIFEGDIISYEDDPLSVVQWHDFLCGWTYKEESAIDPERLRQDGSKHYIIHGNIHQNPELLLQ